jgi:hypothetical protein
MRNVIYAINTTLDGCCDHTKFRPDEETFEYITHLTNADIRQCRVRLPFIKFANGNASPLAGFVKKQAIFGHYKNVL